jgi:fatty acid desaturase
METTQTLSILESRRILDRGMKSRSSEVVFSMKFAIYLSIITAATVALIQGGILLSIIATVILGVMFAHGVELQHQVLHGQGFRNRRLNDWVGVVLGLPMLVSYAGYQASHLRHHVTWARPRTRNFLITVTNTV